jgi:hypothetical protein
MKRIEGASDDTGRMACGGGFGATGALVVRSASPPQTDPAAKGRARRQKSRHPAIGRWRTQLFWDRTMLKLPDSSPDGFDSRKVTPSTSLRNRGR